VDLHRNQFCLKKVVLQLKKEDHCKLKKRKGLVGLVSNFQLGEGKKSQNRDPFLKKYLWSLVEFFFLLDKG